MKCSRLSICKNGDRFKDDEARNIESIFSPRYG
jgi:hypothetical protein